LPVATAQRRDGALGQLGGDRSAKCTQLARPVMRRRTRFQPDYTAWNAAEERQYLTAPQSLTQNRRTLRINAVNLKNTLGLDPVRLS
jgi:hypothetical protein